MISKELLNKNRVLTLSHNRKCSHLIIDAGKDSATIMGISSTNCNDVLIIKIIHYNKYSELVDEVYWICKEFGIKIILIDILGYGIGFYELFNKNIPNDQITIRPINGRKNNDIQNLINDIENGNLRFLQSSELAERFYIKPFLGYSNIMKYHRETNLLIDEIDNLKLEQKRSTIQLTRKNENIGTSRAICLLTYYNYPMNTKQLNEEKQN